MSLTMTQAEVTLVWREERQRDLQLIWISTRLEEVESKM